MRFLFQIGADQEVCVSMGLMDENREWKDIYCNTRYGFICEGVIPVTGNKFYFKKEDTTI